MECCQTLKRKRAMWIGQYEQNVIIYVSRPGIASPKQLWCRRTMELWSTMMQSDLVNDWDAIKLFLEGTAQMPRYDRNIIKLTAEASRPLRIHAQKRVKTETSLNQTQYGGGPRCPKPTMKTRMRCPECIADASAMSKTKGPACHKEIAPVTSDITLN